MKLGVCGFVLFEGLEEMKMIYESENAALLKDDTYVQVRGFLLLSPTRYVLSPFVCVYFYSSIIAW